MEERKTIILKSLETLKREIAQLTPEQKEAATKELIETEIEIYGKPFPRDENGVIIQP